MILLCVLGRFLGVPGPQRLPRMDILPLITTCEQFRERNNAAKLELKALISTGNAFAVIGAGSSKRAGYPLWDEFLADLYRTFPTANHAAIQAAFLAKIASGAPAVPYDPHFAVQELARGQPLAMASALEEVGAEMGGRILRNYLQTQFQRPAVPLPVHEAMLRLPFRGILTTNYDFLLEGTVDKLHGRISLDGLQTRSIDLDNRRNCLYRFINPTEQGRNDARLVLHLHGVADIPQNCIITQEDYARAYPPQLPTVITERDVEGFHLYFLNSLAGMQRIVFFGFSYSDPFIKQVIRQCSSNLWLDGRPMHYLVDGVSSENEEVKMNFARGLIHHGIQLVCFDEPAGSFRAFPDAIGFLGQEKIQDAKLTPVAPAFSGNRKLIEDFARKDDKFLGGEK